MDPLTDASRAEMMKEMQGRHRDLLRPGERLDLVTNETALGVMARLTLQGGADGAALDLEVRVDAGLTKTRGDDAVGLALDALDMTLGEYLESGRGERLPAGFETRELEGYMVSVRGRVRHPALEAEANRLLGEVAVDDWDE